MFLFSRYHSPLGTYIIASSEMGLVCVKTDKQARAYFERWEKERIELRPDDSRHLAAMAFLRLSFRTVQAGSSGSFWLYRSTISLTGHTGGFDLSKSRDPLGSISGSWLLVSGLWLGGGSFTLGTRFVLFSLRFASLSLAIRLFVSEFAWNFSSSS